MKKLYSIRIQNGFESILPVTILESAKFDCINFKSVIENWKTVTFKFVDVDDKSNKKPDISFPVGLPSGLVFPAPLKNLLFPNSNVGLEFLPISISGENWFLVNCLNSTDKYNSIESKFHRDPSLSSVNVSEADEEALLQKLLSVMKSNSTDVSFLSVGTGQIFHIEKLVLEENAILNTQELFTITDSNRALLIALPSFVERVNKLKLRGISFSEIGILAG